MGKKATVNGFTEGLSMDLNALTDTKETLIDALNATLVTGNGNEMILQNDDGNFELKIDEKKVVEFPLPYMIPIGIKEYGGIFYICVYDCTDNHLDGIYTYPSPDYDDNLFKDISLDTSKEIVGNIKNELSPLRVVKYINNKQRPDIYSISDLITPRLQFSLRHPVNIDIQPSYDGTVNLILNDNYNIPRMINSGFQVLSNNKYKYTIRKENSSKLYEVSSQDVFDTQTSLNKRYKHIPILTYKGVENSGNLKVGNYVFYFKYEDADGNETNIMQESGIVSCFKGKDADPLSINGGFRDENSNKLVKFELGNLDIGYDYIRVIYSRDTSDLDQNRVTQVYTIDQKFKINKDSKTCDIQITGNEKLLSSTIDELNQQYVILNSTKSTTQYNNILFSSNVTTHPINYTELTNISQEILPFAIKHNANEVIGNINPETYIDDSSAPDKYEYFNTKNIYYHVGYWNEEFYRFGIVYIYQDGTTSPVFNIRGKEGIPIIGERDSDNSIDTIENSYSTSKYKYKDSTVICDSSTFIYKDTENPKKSKLLENCKGVCRITNRNVSEFDSYRPLYEMGFYMPKFIVNKLKDFDIKGFFYVRQKRMPTILCQAYMMPNDPNSQLPCIYRKRFTSDENNYFKLNNNCRLDTKHYDINLVGESFIWHSGNQAQSGEDPTEFKYKTDASEKLYIEIPKDVSRGELQNPIHQDGWYRGISKYNDKDISVYFKFTGISTTSDDNTNYYVIYNIKNFLGEIPNGATITIGDITYTVSNNTLVDPNIYTSEELEDLKNSWNAQTSSVLSDLQSYLNYEGHLFYFPLFLPNSAYNNFYLYGKDENYYNYERMINYTKRWSAYSPDFLLKQPYFNQFFTGGKFKIKPADISSPSYYSPQNIIANPIGDSYHFHYKESNKYLKQAGDYQNNKYRLYYLDKYTTKYSNNYADVHIVSLTDSSPIASTNDPLQQSFRAKVGSAQEPYRVKYHYYDYCDDDKKKNNVGYFYRKASLLQNSNITLFQDADYGGSNDLSDNDLYNTTPIVRGVYSPYLGISMEDSDYNKHFEGAYGKQDKKYIGIGEIVNIYIPGFDPDINNPDINNPDSKQRQTKLTSQYNIRMHDSSQFYAISNRKEFDEKSYNITKCYRGDCFYTIFTQRINRNFQDPSVPTNDIVVDNETWHKYGIGGTDLDTNNTNTKTSAHHLLNSGDINASALGNWITFKCCSNYNTCIRSIDESNTGERALTGNARSFYPLQKPSASGVNKIPESYVMNDGFNSTVSNKYYTTIDTQYVKNEFQNRIYYSNVSQVNAITNGYRVNVATHFRDYNPEYGNITKILTYMDNLVVVFEHGIGICQIYEKNLITENQGSQVYINSNNILPLKLTILSDTIGSQWIESIIQTPYYIYGIDTTTKKIWRINDRQVEIISDFKVEHFLNKNINITEKDKNTYIGIRNVKAHYNAQKSEVIFTFYNNTDLYEYVRYNTFKFINKSSYPEWDGYSYEQILPKEFVKKHYPNLDWQNAQSYNKSDFYNICTNYTQWNLAYNEINKCFTTFYSWIPSYSGNINNQYYSFNNLVNIYSVQKTIFENMFGYGQDDLDKLNKHFVLSKNDFKGTILYCHSKLGTDIPKPTYWYGIQHPFEFEFTVRDDPSVQKIWNNLQIISNKAEPESFHFEIIGDSYTFKSDKPNIYYRQEKTKELWNNMGSLIRYDKNPNSNIQQQKVSTYFPLYYKRNKFGLNIQYSVNDCIHSNLYDWRYLSGSELIKDEREHNYNLVTHIKCSNRDKCSILYSNSEYVEDRWNIQIPLINMVQKNEAPWSKPPIIVDYIPNDLKATDIDYNLLPKDYQKLEYWPAGLDLNKWTYNKQMPLRDKFIKIRIRYDGTEKAIISAIKTIYTESFA